MNIALIGYGKMGKSIEKLAIERGHSIVAYVDQEHPIETVDLSNTDVAIEFSTPTKVLDHIQFLIQKKIPTVVGTTGWNDELEFVTNKVKEHDGALLYASNFSIGVNLFFELNKKLAQLMAHQSDYYVSMKESHHTEKLDAPSGTAITLAEDIISNHPAVSGWSCPQHPTKNEFNGGIEIEALRIPEVPGNHTIIYNSEIDEISISHQAKSRKGFALGAIIAAEWIINKHGVHTMRDVLKLTN